MSVEFPAVRPTARELTAERWPTNRSLSQSGVTTRRLWGSRPANATLTLSFTNKSLADINNILACHREAKGPVSPLLIPSTITDHMGVEELAIMSRTEWHFTEDAELRATAVGCGLASLEVELRGEISG